MKALTEVSIRAAKPKEKAYKVYDGLGLYLLVDPGRRQLELPGAGKNS
jgi:hypothetical protein